MKQQPPLWILLNDLRRFAPSPVDDHVGGKTVTDALGRDWIGDADARAALAKADQAWQAEIADRNAYVRWIDDRAQRRKALAEKIHDEVLAGRQATPASSSEVFQRRQAALEEFDGRNPELDFYAWRDKH